MALTTAQLIAQLYIGYYNRAPEPEGLNYWIGRVEAGVSLSDIADSFAASPEAIAAYPWLALNNPSAGAVGAFLEAIYQNLFNRSIDADGLAFYSNELLTGLRSPGEIIASIQANANTNTNNTDGQILANKVTVALAWSDAAAANPNFVYDAVSAASAKTILAGVDATQDSVDDAIDTLEDFFATPRSLEEALGNLDAANARLDASLEAAARADKDFPEDESLQDAFITAYDDLDADAELSFALTARNTAQTAVLTAQGNLSNARATASDAQLATNLQTALNAVAGNTTAQEILQARALADGRLAADISANGSNVELLLDLRAAIGSYITAGGDVTVEVDTSAGVDISDLLGELNTVLNALDTPPTAPQLAAVDALIATIGDYTDYSPVAGNATQVALDAALDAAIRRDTLTTNADAAQTAFEGAGVLDNVQAAEEALDAREALIDALETAQGNFDDAQDYFEQFSDLVAAIESAEAAIVTANDAFELIGYVAPVEVAAGLTGTIGNDVFVAGDVDGDIVGFGFLGNDVLYIGSGFTLVSLADNVDIDNSAQGSASTLEVFVQQGATGAVLFIESRAFDGNLTTGFDGIEITLTGVNAADLQYNNGFFTIA